VKKMQKEFQPVAVIIITTAEQMRECDGFNERWI
jgi:hypothetical protein